jgi:hypothetical protein
MEYDRDLGVTVEDKVAVHAVHCEVVRHRLLRSSETLRNDCSSVDSSRARRVP